MNVRMWLAVPAVALLQACASYSGGGAPMAPAMVTEGVLTAPDGMTLYTFDKDPEGGGKSVCNGKCAENWPPLAAADGAQVAAGYSVVVRDDGSRQWAYKGKPLYRWIKDAKPGDKSGDGFNGVWRAARP